MDPRRTAPAAILRAVVASFIIGGLILLLLILTAPDLSDPAYGQKSGGGQLILLQVFGRGVGTIFLISIAIAITVCALAVHTAAIRLMFAMARDNALPAGARLAKIDPVHKTPVIPSIVVGVIALVILVVSTSSPEVFTALTSVAIIMIYIAYLLVTVPMLKKRLRGEWPDEAVRTSGYFSLGRWGIVVNVLAVVLGHRDVDQPGLAARGGLRRRVARVERLHLHRHRRARRAGLVPRPAAAPVRHPARAHGPADG